MYTPFILLFIILLIFFVKSHGNKSKDYKKVTRPTDANALTAFSDILATYFRPRGKMRPFLGKKYGLQDLFDYEFNDKDDIPKLILVRAFEVLPLINVTFSISNENELASAIKKLLESKLPGITWEVDSNWLGPLRKYQIIHHSLPAPFDTLTRQPMALEIYGRVVKIDGIDMESEAGDEWTRKRLGEDNLSKELKGNIVIKIKSATYTNVAYPGVNVPFYL